MSLHIVPCTKAQANDYVALHHRHHDPHWSYKFSLAVCDDNGVVHGVAIVTRPVARGNCDGWTVEVARVATDGTRNACSILLGACRRTAFAMGFQRIMTYTLESETGASLRGAGWTMDGHVRGRSWTCPSRPRETKNTQNKVRWVATRTAARPVLEWPNSDQPDMLSFADLWSGSE